MGGRNCKQEDKKAPSSSKEKIEEQLDEPVQKIIFSAQFDGLARRDDGSPSSSDDRRSQCSQCPTTDSDPQYQLSTEAADEPPGDIIRSGSVGETTKQFGSLNSGSSTDPDDVSDIEKRKATVAGNRDIPLKKDDYLRYTLKNQRRSRGLRSMTSTTNIPPSMRDVPPIPWSGTPPECRHHDHRFVHDNKLKSASIGYCKPTGAKVQTTNNNLSPKQATSEEDKSTGFTRGFRSLNIHGKESSRQILSNVASPTSQLMIPANSNLVRKTGASLNTSTGTKFNTRGQLRQQPVDKPAKSSALEMNSILSKDPSMKDQRSIIATSTANGSTKPSTWQRDPTKIKLDMAKQLKQTPRVMKSETPTRHIGANQLNPTNPQRQTTTTTGKTGVQHQGFAMSNIVEQQTNKLASNEEKPKVHFRLNVAKPIDGQRQISQANAMEEEAIVGHSNQSKIVNGDKTYTREACKIQTHERKGTVEQPKQNKIVKGNTTSTQKSCKIQTNEMKQTGTVGQPSPNKIVKGNTPSTQQACKINAANEMKRGRVEQPKQSKVTKGDKISTQQTCKVQTNGMKQAGTVGQPSQNKIVKGNTPSTQQACKIKAANEIRGGIVEQPKQSKITKETSTHQTCKLQTHDTKEAGTIGQPKQNKIVKCDKTFTQQACKMKTNAMKDEDTVAQSKHCKTTKGNRPSTQQACKTTTKHPIEQTKTNQKSQPSPTAAGGTTPGTQCKTSAMGDAGTSKQTRQTTVVKNTEMTRKQNLSTTARQENNSNHCSPLVPSDREQQEKETRATSKGDPVQNRQDITLQGVDTRSRQQQSISHQVTLGPPKLKTDMQAPAVGMEAAKRHQHVAPEESDKAKDHKRQRGAKEANILRMNNNSLMETEEPISKQHKQAKGDDLKQTANVDPNMKATKLIKNEGTKGTAGKTYAQAANEGETSGGLNEAIPKQTDYDTEWPRLGSNMKGNASTLKAKRNHDIRGEDDSKEQGQTMNSFDMVHKKDQMVPENAVNQKDVTDSSKLLIDRNGQVKDVDKLCKHKQTPDVLDQQNTPLGTLGTSTHHSTLGETDTSWKPRPIIVDREAMNMDFKKLGAVNGRLRATSAYRGMDSYCQTSISKDRGSILQLDPGVSPLYCVNGTAIYETEVRLSTLIDTAARASGRPVVASDQREPISKDDTDMGDAATLNDHGIAASDHQDATTHGFMGTDVVATLKSHAVSASDQREATNQGCIGTEVIDALNSYGKAPSVQREPTKQDDIDPDVVATLNDHDVAASIRDLTKQCFIGTDVVDVLNDHSIAASEHQVEVKHPVDTTENIKRGRRRRRVLDNILEENPEKPEPSKKEGIGDKEARLTGIRDKDAILTGIGDKEARLTVNNNKPPPPREKRGNFGKSIKTKKTRKKATELKAVLDVEGRKRRILRIRPLPPMIKGQPTLMDIKFCESCGDTRQPNGQALFLCPKCKAAYYCTRTCQHQSSKIHKKVCAGQKKKRIFCKHV